jgi:predicted AAA+ superfamily ATPase
VVGRITEVDRPKATLRAVVRFCSSRAEKAKSYTSAASELKKPTSASTAAELKEPNSALLQPRS